MDELISRVDLSMMLSISPDMVSKIVRHGHLPQYQPESKRRLPCFKRQDIDSYLRSVFDEGYPVVRYTPISLADPCTMIDEAARQLGLHSSDVRSWRWARRVPAYKIGHTIRYRVSDLTEWLALCNAELSPRVIPNRPVRRLGVLTGVRD